jgi:hypothetical protein
MIIRNLFIYRFSPFVVIVFLTFFVGCIGPQGQVRESEKEAIQRAMKTYIQDKLTRQGGGYSIEGTKTEFDYLHAGVGKKGDTFVSCADFKVREDVYDVDYYVKSVEGEYAVVKEILHKIKGEPVNKVLWQESK